jgi:hypothetical protein
LQVRILPGILDLRRIFESSLKELSEMKSASARTFWRARACCRDFTPQGEQRQEFFAERYGLPSQVVDARHEGDYSGFDEVEDDISVPAGRSGVMIRAHAGAG